MESTRLRAIIFAAGVFVYVLITGAITFAKPLFNKTPYHTLYSYWCRLGA